MIRTIFKRVRTYLSPDLAIDLGTANTRLYSVQAGLVAEEPSLPPTQYPMIGVSPNCPGLNKHPTRFPLLQGVIADQDAAVSLLMPLIRKGKRHSLIRPRILACAPTDSSDQERHLLNMVLHRAGAAAVTIVPEPFAAAIGSDRMFGFHHAGMVVDIGAGVTDMAVIQEGRILKSAAVRIGCHDMQNAIRDMAGKRHRILPDQGEMERLTRDFCVPTHPDVHKSLSVSGASLIGGEKITAQIEPLEIIETIQPVFTKILDALERALQRLPDKLVCQVIESGICLTGGGACLKRIDQAIESRTNISAKAAEDPLHAVIRGAERIMRTMNMADRTWETIVWPISPATCLPLDQ